MSRFYSRVTARRHRSAGFAVVIAASLLAACGSSAKTPTSPAAHARVQTLLKAAEDAEQRRDYNVARELYLQAIAEASDSRSAAIANREMASALLFWGEYEGAEARLRTSLKHDASQARVWHDLGLVQEHQGNAGEALISLERAVALAPNEPRARIAYAALLVKQSQFSEAILQYKALLKMPIPERIEVAIHKALRMLENEDTQAP